MCGNVNIFIAGIEDAERYENKATMHKVDLKELIAKLKNCMELTSTPFMKESMTIGRITRRLI